MNHSTKEKTTQNSGKRKRRIFRFIGITVMLAALLIILYLCNPQAVGYLMHDDIDGLTDYIRREGQYGELILIALQAVETFSIFLPALPVYLAAGIIFGKIKGILLCYTTNLILNAIMFTLARRGKKVIQGQKSSADNNAKTQNIIQMVKNMKNPDRAMYVLYLIPVIPNGLIPTIAAQTKIRFSHFMRDLAICCLPSISVCVIFGDALLTIDWSFLIPLIVVLAAAGILVFIFRKPLMNWWDRKIQEFVNKKSN